MKDGGGNAGERGLKSAKLGMRREGRGVERGWKT